MDGEPSTRVRRFPHKKSCASAEDSDGGLNFPHVDRGIRLSPFK